LRFQNYTETNFESIISSSIPISNLHFLFGSASNLQILGGEKNIDKIFPENIRQLLKNKTINFNWKSGKLISSMFFFKNKGDININSKISKKIFRDFNISYINWAPVSIQEIRSNFSDLNINSLGIDCCIFNHTGIKEIFIKIGNQFDILKKRNAFVDNFLKEFSQRDGEEIFEESRESIEKIISAYHND
jgi:tubulin gamma